MKIMMILTLLTPIATFAAAIPLLTARDATGVEVDAEVEALFAPHAAPRTPGGPDED